MCQRCGRVATVLDDVELQMWLVAPSREAPGRFVVRCPQHISESSLRESNKPYGKKMLARVAENKAVDALLLARRSPSDPYALDLGGLVGQIDALAASRLTKRMRRRRR